MFFYCFFLISFFDIFSFSISIITTAKLSHNRTVLYQSLISWQKINNINKILIFVNKTKYSIKFCEWAKIKFSNCNCIFEDFCNHDIYQLPIFPCLIRESLKLSKSNNLMYINSDIILKKIPLYPSPPGNLLHSLLMCVWKSFSSNE